MAEQVFSRNDVIRLQFDCKGKNGQTVRVRQQFTALALGLGVDAVNAAPAVNVQFNAQAYSELIAQAMDTKQTQEQRNDAHARAEAMIAALHADTAEAIDNGAVTPGESIVTAVVNFAVKNGLVDDQGVNQPFSRSDTGTAFRLTEDELNVSQGVQLGDAKAYVVSATATWGN